ncbi:MAG: DUF1772 domain-containing protein [Gammaproteobacteria bacterium]|nr:DUF1772 domain-containing protein [Gammaproteobacteria bacterium]
MNLRPTFLICLLATVLCALNAGFFYTWSFTIMQSLDLIEDNHAIVAMNAINANIRNGWFAAIFFGSPVLVAVCSITLLFQKRFLKFSYTVLALLCLLANLYITMTVHLPLNADLADGKIILWSEYSNEWTSKNHWRTIVTVVALVLMMLMMFVPSGRHTKRR